MAEIAGGLVRGGAAGRLGLLAAAAASAAAASAAAASAAAASAAAASAAAAPATAAGVPHLETTRE